LKTRTLWNISVTTAAEAEEAVTELFHRLFNQPAVSYVDVESNRTTVSIYSPAQPNSSQLREQLSGGLAEVERSGLKIAPARISVKKLRRKDWVESWKRHFQPINIGSALLIKPGWSRRRPSKGQALVILNPGLSFGTGQHPTTGFCLKQLVLSRDRSRPQSFLDIGTGSGILAIAAAKLGYSPVEAFDSDPDSVRIANTNARQNRVLGTIRIRNADITRLPRRGGGKFDMVCANLTADLLVSERDRITNQLKAGGILVLAGILKAEFPTVQRIYRNTGLKLVFNEVKKEWRSGAFRSPSGSKRFH
jgi:ribosomal protein L11 methyltransferase